MVQCMAINRGGKNRCTRNSTKMLAPIPWRGEAPSMGTVYLCGICARRLDAGSQSLNLQLDDGARHTVFAGRGVGEIYVKEGK